MVQEKTKIVTSKDSKGQNYAHPVTPGQGKRGTAKPAKGGSVSTDSSTTDAPLICDRCGNEYH